MASLAMLYHRKEWSFLNKLSLNHIIQRKLESNSMIWLDIVYLAKVFIVLSIGTLHLLVVALAQKGMENL